MHRGIRWFGYPCWICSSVTVLSSAHHASSLPWLLQIAFQFLLSGKEDRLRLGFPHLDRDKNRGDLPQQSLVRAAINEPPKGGCDLTVKQVGDNDPLCQGGGPNEMCDILGCVLKEIFCRTMVITDIAANELLCADLRPQSLCGVGVCRFLLRTRMVAGCSGGCCSFSLFSS